MNGDAMKVGDIVLVSTDHFVSKLIRFGQRKYGRDCAQWNHVAVYIGGDTIVEALTTGICESPLSKYSPVPHVSPHGKLPGYYRHVPVSAVIGDFALDAEFAMRFNALHFARACVGERYGFLTILAIAAKALTRGRVDLGLSGTHICSGLAARCLERMGYIWEPYDPEELTPAYLASVLP